MGTIKWQNSGSWQSRQDESGTADQSENSGAADLQQGYQHQYPALTYGLVGWWPLTHTSGNAVDYSGNGNDGTHSGTTRGVAGKGGIQATSFDGSDDYVAVGDDDKFTSDQLTAVVWTKIKSVPSRQRYFEKAAGGGEREYIFILEDDGTGTAVMYADVGNTNGSWDINYQSNVAVPTNKWTLLGWSIDTANDEVRFYKDGSLEESTSYNGGGLVNTSEPLNIGADKDGPSEVVDGIIADCRIYNRALSDNEIKALYRLGTGTHVSPPAQNQGGISYYSFNSSNANDQWGSNDGTVNGATYKSSGGPRNDGAYSFDGTDDYIEAGYNISSDLSFSLWFKTSNTSSRQQIIQFFGANNDWIVLGTNVTGNNGDLHVRYWDEDNSAGNNNINGSYPVVATGNWHHAVAIFDSNNKDEIRVYVNGDIYVKVSLANASDSLVLDDRMWIGNGVDNPNNRWYDGKIDDVRIYDRALTPQEIQKLYQYGTLGINLNKNLIMK